MLGIKEMDRLLTSEIPHKFYQGLRDISILKGEKREPFVLKKKLMEEWVSITDDSEFKDYLNGIIAQMKTNNLYIE